MEILQCKHHASNHFPEQHNLESLWHIFHTMKSSPIATLSHCFYLQFHSRNVLAGNTPWTNPSSPSREISRHFHKKNNQNAKMGIKGLSKLITTYAPRAMKEVDPKKYTGRLIAIDASVMIYQYLVITKDCRMTHRLPFARTLPWTRWCWPTQREMSPGTL